MPGKGRVSSNGHTRCRFIPADPARAVSSGGGRTGMRDVGHTVQNSLCDPGSGANRGRPGKRSEPGFGATRGQGRSRTGVDSMVSGRGSTAHDSMTRIERRTPSRMNRGICARTAPGITVRDFDGWTDFPVKWSKMLGKTNICGVGHGVEVSVADSPGRDHRLSTTRSPAHVDSWSRVPRWESRGILQSSGAG